MSKKHSVRIVCFIILVVLLTTYQTAFAHEGVSVGDYEIEVGWVNEPPIAGQQNAIVVNVSNTGSGEAQPVEDVSTLTVTISYGGQNKELTLQPLGEDTPGQFSAPILPTLAGQYTITLGGKLGDTDVNAEVEPEEVESAAILQFPNVQSEQQRAANNWLIWLSLLIGSLGVVLGITALRKAH